MDPLQVSLVTNSDCELAISYLPMFKYDATGGRGNGVVEDTDKEGQQQVVFDPQTLYIPSLCSKTTSMNGIPMPCIMNIAIHPRKLEGERPLANMSLCMTL